MNAAPVKIQIQYQFFKRMMGFFFPDKGLSMEDDDALSQHSAGDLKDSRNASLLGLPASSSTLERKTSPSLATRPITTPSSIRRSSKYDVLLLLFTPRQRGVL